jgi:hypothetical protein
VLPLFLIGGCNDVYTPPDRVSVTIVNAGGFPLEGVQICENETTNCVPSDTDGRATLELPPGEEVSYTAAKQGYGRLLIADVTDATFVRSIELTLFGDESTADWMEAVDAQYPMMGTGSVTVLVCSQCLGEIVRVEGATLDLTTATGTTFYEEEDEGGVITPRLDLEATTSLGTGGFVEVVPGEFGEFQIEVGGAVRGCSPLTGWPSNAENRIRVPVRAGYFTVANVRCLPPL